LRKLVTGRRGIWLPLGWTASRLGGLQVESLNAIITWAGTEPGQERKSCGKQCSTGQPA